MVDIINSSHNTVSKYRQRIINNPDNIKDNILKLICISMHIENDKYLGGTQNHILYNKEQTETNKNHNWAPGTYWDKG